MFRLSDRAQTVLVAALVLALMGSCAPLMLDAMEHEQDKRSIYGGQDLEREMAVNQVMEEML